ncbi:hypothetical protein [Streptomyces sp. NPDC001480]|uniref:hypothetical protein n=1 Tax=Streptomyces sp. NPDC001480 TaxID=3364577 RepID=UPI0036C51AE4
MTPPAGAEAALSILRAEAAAFFSLPESVKRQHGSADFNFGFRPYGRQYSVSPDRPDLNESFVYWANHRSKIPNGNRITPFLDALSAYWEIAARATEGILAGLADRYGYTEPGPLIRRSSYVEVNWYLRDDQRDLLQDRHEDGHLLTLATSDGPGLEIEIAGRMQPAEIQDGALLAMPGSLLTAMTGGQVQPLYHQVSNHRLPRRITVLFLANPPLDQPTRPYVGTQHDALDIAAQARTSGAMFGLPPAPVLPSPLEC